MADDSLFAGPAIEIKKASSNDDLFAGPAIPIKSDTMSSRVGQMYENSKRELQDLGTGIKDTAIGAAQGVLGAEELLPEPFHGAAVRGEKSLEQYVTNPTVARAGQFAPMLVGGVGAAAPKAVEAGEGVLGWLGSLGSKALSGAKTGAIAGGGAGVLSPTGKEDFKESLKEKGKLGVESAGTGALVGAGLGAAAPLYEGAKSLAPILSGKNVRTAAENLKAAATEQTATAAREELENAVLAESKAGTLEQDLAKHEAEMARIDRAQQELAEREQKRATLGRDAAQALDPQKLAGVRARVSADLRERVREAQEAAHRAGLSAEDARNFAIEQEGKVAEAEHAAQQLSDELTANAGAMDANTLGAKLQSTADGIYKRLVKAREERAGFGQAVQSADSKGLIVGTDKAVSYIGDKIKNIRNPETRALMLKIRQELVTNVRRQDGEMVPVPKLNLRSADSLRKWADDLLESEEKSIQATGAAVGKEARAHIVNIKKILVEEARKSWAPYDKAMTTFAELSKPINDFERKGPMASIVRTDEKTREFKLLQGEVTSRLLQKTSKGANAVARLVQENPELKEDMRAYFQQQLYGSEGLGRNVTPARMQSFITKNEQALKQTGLFKDFHSAFKHLSEAHNTLIEAREIASEAKKTLVPSKEAEAKAADKVVKSEQSMAERAEKREQETLKTKPVDTAKAAEDKAKQAAVRLSAEQATESGNISSLKKLIGEAVKEGKVSAETSQELTDLSEHVNRPHIDAKELAGRIEKTFKVLRDEGKISDESKKIMNKEIDKLKGAIISEQTARNIARRAVKGAILATFGYAITRDFHITFGLF